MKTIAIIDDDIHIGDMLREVLVQEGYSVLRAYSGTEALYLLSQNKPDLVLLDLMLPGLSGEEVLPHIENIPVIVLSAKVDVQDKVNLLLGGAADYMTKPFNILEVKARIKAIFRRMEPKKGTTENTGILESGDMKLDRDGKRAYIQGRTTWRNQISFRWRFGFGYGFPFSDSTGAACEADPNGVCHLKTADGKSQTGNFKECPA